MRNQKTRKLFHREIAWRLLYNLKDHKQPFGELEVHHLDFDKKNNHPDNLHVCTKEEHEELHKAPPIIQVKSRYRPPKRGRTPRVPLQQPPVSVVPENSFDIFALLMAIIKIVFILFLLYTVFGDLIFAPTRTVIEPSHLVQNSVAPTRAQVERTTQVMPILPVTQKTKEQIEQEIAISREITARSRIPFKANYTVRVRSPTLTPEFIDQTICTAKYLDSNRPTLIEYCSNTCFNIEPLGTYEYHEVDCTYQHVIRCSCKQIVPISVSQMK